MTDPFYATYIFTRKMTYVHKITNIFYQLRLITFNEFDLGSKSLFWMTLYCRQ